MITDSKNLRLALKERPKTIDISERLKNKYSTISFLKRAIYWITELLLTVAILIIVKIVILGKINIFEGNNHYLVGKIAFGVLMVLIPTGIINLLFYHRKATIKKISKYYKLEEDNCRYYLKRKWTPSSEE